MLLIKCRKGSAAADVVIGAAIIVFVVLPVFSFIIEKYLILNKAQIIKDAVDMTNIAAYNAINAGNLGKAGVDIDMDKVEEIYRRLLMKNLNLAGDLAPLPGSLAEGRVSIKSLAVFTGGFPDVCPEGTGISRPSVHSIISIPVRPSLYRQLILNILGKQFIELEIHVDSEIPVNR